MQAFLHYIASYIQQNHPHNTANLCVVLPNKRGALYLKQHLAQVFNKTIWLPSIISAEDLISHLSGLHTIDNIDLICELYAAYVEVLKDKAESFDAFTKWGNMMLQDFNEADRFLVDTKLLYLDLKNIKEIENWSLSATELTQTQQDYIDFMAQMGNIYEVYTKNLLEKKVAYQGLMYRIAHKQYKQSEYLNKFSNVLICGFNALNKVETIIFSDLIKNKKAQIIWDADKYYLNNEAHEAGLFLRQNFNNQWLNTKTLISNYFYDIPKHIDVVAVPKQIGQAQVASHQLTKWINEGRSIHKTAIILADESLLFPLLNQLPPEVKSVNITMEYPLRLSPIYNLAESLINLHLGTQKNNTTGSFYFTDLFKILQNSIFKRYYQSYNPNIQLHHVIQKIIDKNYVWIDVETLSSLFGDNIKPIQLLFTPWKNSQNGIECISHIINVFNECENETLKLSSSENEYLHIFTKYFNRLQTLIKQHDYLKSLQTLKSLFKQVIGQSSVPFIGEPLEGLQIMGVLETRTLDFDNIIMLGVNEGILPSGKSVNSFIPSDLKRHYNMPLYSDKDAVYAYHFYRIIQRASNLLITYNTEQNVFGGQEKSRFITQLQFELQKHNSEHQINERMLSGDELVASTPHHIEISKNIFNLQPIIQKITSNGDYGGLSPSALITYKDCNLKFFFRYGVGLKETEEIEENAESNTQGSILHEALETLYTPFIGRVLTEKDIFNSFSQIETVVNTSFLKHFSQKESRFGKNYLQQKVLNQFVKKQLQQDLRLIKTSQTNNELLSIIALEKTLQTSINIDFNGQPLQVFIKGNADRIDRLGSKVRIIDYKTSVKQSDKFAFNNFDLLFTHIGYNKMLQLFIYAWLAVKNNIAKPEELLPCIIPFKKDTDDPKIILKEKSKETLTFNTTLLQEFEVALIENIKNILNLSNKFTQQTEDMDICAYCPYAVICNITSKPIN